MDEYRFAYSSLTSLIYRTLGAWDRERASGSDPALNVGDLIGVPPMSNSHGCRDYAILRYLGDGMAEVVEAQSCHSCWQVGHDGDHVFATVGEMWPVRDEDVVPNDREFSTDVAFVLR